jgi:hypothetical protein
MKFFTFFSLFGILFLFLKFFNLSVSSFEVFGWIDATSEMACHHQPPYDGKTMTIPLKFFFGLSAATASLFFLIFCMFSLLCLCLNEEEYGQELSFSAMKFVVEVMILFALFDPITSAQLLLRDCLSGYIMATSTLVLYAVVVTAFLLLLVCCFHKKGLLYKNWPCSISSIIICGFFHGLQVTAGLFSFTSFFAIPSTEALTDVKYGIMVLSFIFCFSSWIKGTVTRLSIFHYLIQKRDDYHCERCCIDIISSLVNISTSSIILYMLKSNGFLEQQVIHSATFVSLVIVLVIGIIQSLTNYFLCIGSVPDFETVENEKASELIRLADDDDNNEDTLQ